MPPVALPLSRLNGGINRFETQALENQCVDALDVIEDDGDVRRRDAFKAIACGPAHVLPAGKTVIVTTIAAAYTNWYDRAIDVFATNVGGTNGDIFVGCDEQFDGIEWGHVATVPTPSGHRYLKPQYWNGSSWVDFTAVDFTRRRIVSGGNIYYVTLCKDGRISWHTGQFSDSWVQSSINSITKYWIRLSVVGGVLSTSGGLAMDYPGARAFLLEPVRAIFPLRLGYGIDSILIAGDRRTPRGSELGAALAHWKSLYDGPQNLHVIEDEGSGVFGQVSFPAALSGDDGDPLASMVTANNAAPSAYGSSGNILTRTRQPDIPLGWLTDSTHLYDQHRGSVVFASVAPTGGLSNSSATLSGGFNCTISGLRANQLEHFRLRCVTKGAGGTPLNEEREITGNTTTALSYHDHFSIAPDTDNRFAIIRPHSRLYAKQSEFEDGVEIGENAADTATMVSTSRPFQTLPDIANEYVHWEIGRELPWKIAGAPFWTGTTDVQIHKFLLSNGKSGLLEYDGETLRPVFALFDPDNPAVQPFTEAVNDVDTEALSSRELVAYKLRQVPPSGRYVTEYHGRIVVADGYDVWWSAPAPDTDIWPLGFTEKIRDSENQQITGLATLGDKLLVWTPTSILASDPPDDSGRFYFNPFAQGVGFLSGRTVCKISIGGSSALIGAAGDGVKVVTGSGEPQDVLDDWRRLSEGGVNTRMMKSAVAAVAKHSNQYVIAFPSPGSDVNDRIGVYNYVAKKWWKWSAPFGGVSAIATDYDGNGQERLLFGFNDGHVCVLTKAATDDGDEIEGWARSPVQAPDASRTTAAVALMVTAQETGPVETLTLKAYLNKRATAIQEHEAAFDDGADAYDGTEVYGAAGVGHTAGVYAGVPLVTKKLNLPSGSKCERFQFEVAGTGQWRFRMCEVLLSPKGYESK